MAHPGQDVVLTQPGLLRRRPIVEVVGGRLREGILAEGVPYAEQHVIEDVNELLPPEIALVRAGEGCHDEGEREGRMVGTQQRPPSVVLAQGRDVVKIHSIPKGFGIRTAIHGRCRHLNAWSSQGAYPPRRPDGSRSSKGAKSSISARGIPQASAAFLHVLTACSTESRMVSRWSGSTK